MCEGWAVAARTVAVGRHLAGGRDPGHDIT